MISRELPFASILKRDDGIVQIHYARDAKITIRESKLIFEAVREVMDHTIDLYPLLITSEPGSMVDAESKTFYASKYVSKNISSTAIIAKNLMEVSMVNLYLYFQKPHSPTRFFMNEKDAVQWLLKHKNHPDNRNIENTADRNHLKK